MLPPRPGRSGGCPNPFRRSAAARAASRSRLLCPPDSPRSASIPLGCCCSRPRLLGGCGGIVFSATAARRSVLNASASIVSPSRTSMARRVLPSRLALKRREGYSNAAPLAKVNFTLSLYVSPVHITPIMRPHQNTAHRIRRLSPFHLLNHLGVSLLDEPSNPSQRLAPPIAQLLDSRLDQLRGRGFSVSSRRAALDLFHEDVARPSREDRQSAPGATAPRFHRLRAQFFRHDCEHVVR